MNFTLHVEDETFVQQHMDAIRHKLQTALMLIVAELQEFEWKRTGFIGKGISGDASLETARAQERLRLEHERNFGSEEQQRQQAKEIQENLTRNTMVK